MFRSLEDEVDVDDGGCDQEVPDAVEDPEGDEYGAGSGDDANEVH